MPRMAHRDDVRNPVREAVEDLLRRYHCNIPGLADLCAGAALNTAEDAMGAAGFVRVELEPEACVSLQLFLDSVAVR